MRAINHALTGAAIAFVAASPVIAVLAALVSHFVCDAIPHGGSRNNSLISRSFQSMLLIDAVLCGALVVLLAALQPQLWLLASVCAFVAASPDFMWLGKYLRAQTGKPPLVVRGPLLVFHTKIQWFERPIGYAVEAAWLLAGGFILLAVVI